MAANAPSSQSETALVVFTLLMPASAGLSLVGLLGDPQGYICLAAALVGAVGLAASIAHLARPLRAPFSIIHWRQSWLSREIIASGAYWFIVVAWCLAAYFSLPAIASGLAICAVLAGLGMQYVMAQAYRLHTRPAWDGPENLAEFVAIMLGVGPALGIYILSAGLSPALAWTGALAVGLGGALDYWAYRHRARRLAEVPSQMNTSLALAKYQSLARSITISQGLNALALILAVLSAAFPLFVPWLWLIIFLVELISHIVAREIFYSLSQQVKFVPRLRQPWTRPG